MNEKLKYAEMLEMPLSTSNIVIKPSKKKKKIETESVKEQVISKVNENTVAENVDGGVIPKLNEDFTTSTIVKAKKNFLPFKLNTVNVELCIIGILLATIFLTSIFMPNSGINSFFGSAFKSETVAVDERTFEEFAPVFAFSQSDAVTEDGIIKLKATGSVYAPCDGKLVSFTKTEDGLYTATVSHSENFKTVISGLKYLYAQEGDTVYKTIPFGYVDGGEVSVYFMDGNEKIVTDNVIATCSVVWG